MTMLDYRFKYYSMRCAIGSCYLPPKLAGVEARQNGTIEVWLHTSAHFSNFNSESKKLRWTARRRLRRRDDAGWPLDVALLSAPFDSIH